MLSKEKICKAFSRSALQYDQYATWQQKTAKLLVNKIFEPPQSVLDLGCGTGEVAFLIKKRYPDSEVHGLDLAEEMIMAALNRAVLENQPEINFKVGDMEQLDYPAESFELVISNIALHWLNHFQVCLNEINRVLKPEGRFLFSLPVFGSLSELKKSYEQVTGNYRPEHPFPKPENNKRDLLKFGFRVDDFQIITEVCKFKSITGLLNSLRKIGGKTQKPNSLTRIEYNKLKEIYPKIEGNYNLTYQILIAAVQKI
jgi:malonyl-CoA O-methyltransferase